MGRRRKEKQIIRPHDNLSPRELQRQWNRYLDTHMGKPTARPRIEILMTPEQLEFYAEKVPQDWMKLEPSARVQAFTAALQRSLPKLPLIQQLVIKKYYGIDGKDVRNQKEIASDLGLPSQVTAFRYLTRAKRRLKSLIRSELRRVVKESVGKPADADD